jgi:hypothetical protein
MALIIAYMAFVPSMIAIGLGEAFSARGWLYYALAGGFIGFMLAMLFQGSAPDDFLAAGSDLDVLPPDQSIYDPVFLAVLVGSGMFGGLALLAGDGPNVRRVGDAAAYFACAVSIFRAKAEKMPAKR